MTLATCVVLVYGLFTLIGGIIGYVKAQSQASLIAGSVSGIVLLGSAYGMAEGVRAASWIVLIAAILLGVRFLKTWLKNRRVMPDLLTVILSALTLLLVGMEMFGG